MGKQVNAPAFLLDEDSRTVEGLPRDEYDERTMKRASFTLLEALHRARGLPPPLRPMGPRATFKPLSREFVERFIRQPEARSRPTPIPGEGAGTAVIRAVAHAFEITPALLIGRGRQRPLVCARIVAGRLLRDLTFQDGTQRFSLPQIGRMMGRDHSTICYYLSVFDAYSRGYPIVDEVYKALGKGAR